MREINRKIYTRKRGALLIELLMALSILAIILSLAAQSMFVSLQSEKTARDRDAAVGLLAETLEAVRAVSDERWRDLYDLTKGSQHYYTLQSDAKWSIAIGDEAVTVSDTQYSRYFVIEDVNRCADIGPDGAYGIASSTACTPANNYLDDPGTQKVTAVVSWGEGSFISASEYLFRWRNSVCKQTDWSGLYNSGNTVLSCGTGRFDTVDSSISTSTGTLKLE